VLSVAVHRKNDYRKGNKIEPQLFRILSYLMMTSRFVEIKRPDVKIETK
jgi:hypothetical protein